MRGQHLIIEYMIFVLIGLSICIATISIFNSFGGFIKQKSSQDQFEEAANLVSSLIIKSACDSNEYSAYRFSLPKKLGGSLYEIELEGNIITVIPLVLNSQEYSTEIYNLDKKYTLQGKTQSIYKSVEIRKSGNIIEIVSIVREGQII